VSRNIGSTSCRFCFGDDTIALEETARPITRDEGRRYFDEYEGMLVANARCSSCLGRYLAWVDGSKRQGSSQYPRPHLDGSFGDLSFRASFNDEPAPTDLPTPEILARLHAELCDLEIEGVRAEIAQLEGNIAGLQQAKSETSSWERYRQ
jgi:hypothetical protein